ncbi:hypothetical protein SprV_0100222900 [Sparganum proliferum]
MSAQTATKMKDKFEKIKRKIHPKRDRDNNTKLTVTPGDHTLQESVSDSPWDGSFTETLPVRPVRPRDGAFMTYPHAIVKFDFKAEQPDELNAKRHELLVLLKRVDENWYYACTSDQRRVGFIPANFIDVRIDVPRELNAWSGGVSTSHENSPTPQMSENPYKRAIDSCAYDVPKPRAATPRTTQDSPNGKKVSTSSLVSPIPEGALLLVVQDFSGENPGDLSASSNEIIRWLEPGAQRGQTPPEDWIKCAKLNGISGDFPGNLVRPPSDDNEILTCLKNIAQAEAIRDYEGLPGQCIPLKKGEVLYLSEEDANFYRGQSASGKQGKVPKDVCKVTVQLH